METPAIRGFRHEGGIVTIATYSRPAESMRALLGLGQRHLAEKFLQEAAHKQASLAESPLVSLPAPMPPSRLAPMTACRPDPVHHFFGRLQGNKIRRIASNFHVIESISSPLEAKRLARVMEEGVREVDGQGGEGHERVGGFAGHIRCSQVFIQVNVGREPQKHGVMPEKLDELVATCLGHGLPLSGLMTIPPKGIRPDGIFRWLRAQADKHGLRHCQMGFSADYRIAIDCGSTHLRIGSLVFNPSAA